MPDDEEGKLIKTKVWNLMSSLTLFNIILIYWFFPCGRLNAIVAATTTQRPHSRALSTVSSARAHARSNTTTTAPTENQFRFCTRYRRLKRRKLDWIDKSGIAYEYTLIKLVRRVSNGTHSNEQQQQKKVIAMCYCIFRNYIAVLSIDSSIKYTIFSGLAVCLAPAKWDNHKFFALPLVYERLPLKKHYRFSHWSPKMAYHWTAFASSIESHKFVAEKKQSPKPINKHILHNFDYSYSNHRRRCHSSPQHIIFDHVYILLVLPLCHFCFCIHKKVYRPINIGLI